MNHIRYVEYGVSHPADFIFDQPKGYDCFLLLLIHTPAAFWTDGKLAEYPAHSAVLFPPDTKIYYRACQNSYENDWIRFESDETFVTAFPLTGIPFPVADPDYIHNLFQLLTWEHSFPQPDSERIIHHLLQILFNRLRTVAESTLINEYSLPHIHELLALRKSIYHNPQLSWDIPSMADRMHLSEGYLQSIYRKAFGVSCMEDVITGRLRMACDRLSCTDRPVADIAEECGYHNVEHFCRQFRRKMKVSPGQYRRQKL